MTDKVAIVIDNGSSTIKAGLADETDPRVIPNILGVPYSQDDQQDTYIGSEVLSKSDIFSLKRPTQRGFIADWDNMEKIWQHTFQNELKVNPSEHPVLLTDGPLSGTNERREMIQRMFEKFNTPSFNISRRPALALYSSGKTTGVVLSSGDGITHTVPIYEGYAMAHAVCRLEVAGEDLTRYFGTLLPPGHSFTSPAELEILRTMKEKLSYVTLDPAGELRRAQESSTIEREYELPDGQIISVGKGRFLTPDALFNPSAISGGEEKGVHELVFESIKKCDMDTRRTLYQNIFVTGGSTLFNGFTERLTKEVVRLVPPSIQDIIQVEAIPDRYAAWKGGCAYASLLASQKMWITKEEYQEHGFTIVTRKCS